MAPPSCTKKKKRLERKAILQKCFKQLKSSDPTLRRTTLKALDEKYYIANEDDDTVYEKVQEDYPMYGCPLAFYVENFLSHEKENKGVEYESDDENNNSATNSISGSSNDNSNYSRCY